MFKQEKVYATFAEFLLKVEENPSEIHQLELEKVDGAIVVISVEISGVKKNLILISSEEESA